YINTPFKATRGLFRYRLGNFVMRSDNEEDASAGTSLFKFLRPLAKRCLTNLKCASPTNKVEALYGIQLRSVSPPAPKSRPYL
ncbi:hypothetical protein AVEN_197774-1, partial [Araneus ventricosus]